jgi:hypothetical protein
MKMKGKENEGGREVGRKLSNTEERKPRNALGLHPCPFVV